MIMLVSHEKKFIYLKTAKTGGTSVEVYFERFCMSPGEWFFSHARDQYESATGIIGFRGMKTNKPENCKWWNHMPAADVKAQLGSSIWNDYFKFCVVRNPYDKAVSAFYFDCFRNKKEAPTTLAGRREAFENWLIERRVNTPTGRNKFIIGNQFCLDRVIYFEKMKEDLEKICTRIGVPWIAEQLPVLKSGYRPPNTSCSEMYTNKAKKLIMKKHAFELDLFNYSFPED